MTSETEITLCLDLDQSGRGKIQTGSGFLDHMLDLFQVHSGTSLSIECKGDVHIDMHHSAEDIGIVLGQALQECLGDKKGIERYGFYYVPMDEALARVVVDFSGRIGFVWNVKLENERIGNMDMELFRHFFKSIAENARMNLHVELLYGEDHHHNLEAIFKAFARAVAMGISPSRRVSGVPSSKGIL
jgi:imidazoleglycerol-phosphate dehydratase